MSIKRQGILFWLLLLLTISLLQTSVNNVRAQSSSVEVSIQPPDTHSFPAISTTITISEPSGMVPIQYSQPQISVLEDGHELPIQNLEIRHSNLVFVLAVNGGPTLGIRGVDGISRYNVIQKALAEWSATEGAILDGDHLDFLTNQESQPERSKSISNWRETVLSFNPEMRNLKPSLDVFSRAIDLAASVSVPSQTQRVVFLVTPTPDIENLDGLENLAARMSSHKVTATICLLGPETSFSNPGSILLSELAVRTGGQAIFFSGVEEIPSLQSLLEPLRTSIFVTYQSQIKKSGRHSLALSLDVAGQTLITPAQEFQLDVLPPNPMLLSPPSEILITTPPNSRNPAADLAPKEQEIDMLVEFPDGYPRPLHETRLLVDGKLVSINDSPPFEHFTWDLTDYTLSAKHELQVEVIDCLGLQRSSQPFPVQVDIHLPQPNLLRNILQENLVTIIIVLLAGGLLLIVLLPKRKTDKPVRRRWSFFSSDPLHQPVAIKQETLRRSHRSSHIPLSHGGSSTSHAMAYLTRLNLEGQPESSTVVYSYNLQLMFGKDPKTANILVESPAVQASHAMLKYNPNGTFTLTDMGSIAGTWVNHTPLGEQEVTLKHGDLIQIADVTYRFTLTNPPPQNQPKVKSYHEIP